MRLVLTLAALALIGAPLAHAQDAPARATSAAPAPATSSIAPPSLEAIHNFARVYQIIRKAYVNKVDNQALMHAAISGMLAKLDPHSAYLDRSGIRNLQRETSGKYSGLGVVVTNRDHQLAVIAPLDGSPAAKAGIEPGDVILKIDGKPVEPGNIDTSMNKLRGKAGTQITLTWLHAKGGLPVTKTLTRAVIAMTSVHLYALAPGYLDIRIGQFQGGTAHSLQRELRQWIEQHGQPKGVVLDLRNNPGGLVREAVATADTFLNGGVVVSMRGRIASNDVTFKAHAGDMLHGAPMVVLVNHGTASAAEILSGALKDHQRALIMGQRTFGKGVVQTIIPVDATHMLKLTTARYYTPDGTSIQAEGITPDIIIPDLVARVGNAPPTLIDSEADLPHHLANGKPAAVRATRAASARTLADTSALAKHDYAMAQALNVLKGLVLAHE